jgi:putative flippase GtrA
MLGAALDFSITLKLLQSGAEPWAAKSIACGVGLALNFVSRKYLVFIEPAAGPWK